ncbi:Pentatricopeptide repeat-containing protein [Rhynchospora pubera]|uniref:Pentatricopeptide repeat-containing protein n=1 Tax=Rhynchospora pubera TaxID=906938 RepID=A0AAV8D4B9_9POAL|nr:Pentatricopeptide repeat-containing protein [Rhynchospora pubera]
MTTTPKTLSKTLHSPALRSLDQIAKLITTHPSSLPLRPLLHSLLPPSLLSTSPSFLPSLLSRLSLSHSPSFHSLHLFLYSLITLPSLPFPDLSLSLCLTLHSLSRSHHLPSSLHLLSFLSLSRPSLLSPRVLSLLLSSPKLNFPSTLDLFARAEKIWARAGIPFGPEEFASLLRTFCIRGRVVEAHAAYKRLYSKFPFSQRPINTLLLGFKQSGDVVALDTFYHGLVVRGFEPDSVTYCIRIDAYCKNGRFEDALKLFEEMGKRENCEITIKTVTTLIHGAGIVKKPRAARKLFDEMGERGLSPDRGAYNALMGAYVKAKDLKSAMEVMAEMETNEVGVDDVSYNMLFCGLNRTNDLEGIWNLYQKMVQTDFIPRTRTIMLLMKTFCKNGRPDLGLEMWDYLVGKGCCPHVHALDWLVTALCCRGAVEEAYRCFKDVTERGQVPSQRAFRVLESSLAKEKEMEKFNEISRIMEDLRASRCVPS